MEIALIFDGKATIEDLCKLNDLGFEFDVEDGKITWMGKETKHTGDNR